MSGNTAGDPPRSSPGHAGRSSAPTASSPPARSRRTTTSSPTSAVPDRRAVRQRHRLLLALGSTQLERSQNAVLTGQTAEQRIGNIEDIITGGEGTGDVHDAARRPADGTPGARRTARLGRHARHPDRCVLAMYSNPTYDPNRIVDPDFDAARSPSRISSRRPATRCSPTPTRALHARVDVQGAHHRHRPGRRRRHPRQPVRAADRVDATADVQLDPELRRLELRRRPARCSGAAATSRSPRRPSTSASPDDRRRAGLGRRRAHPFVDNQPTRGGEHVRQHRQPRPAACRCWRCAASASRRTRWSPCTWRWSPPPSPTTG